MKVLQQINNHFRERREMKRFRALLREVEAPFNYDLDRLQGKNGALEKLLDILVTRNGISSVLHQHRIDGTTDRDRLSNLYWRLMAGSQGPTSSGKNVATAAITDPTFLMNLLRLEQGELNNREFGILAWKIAEARWPKTT